MRRHVRQAQVRARVMLAVGGLGGELERRAAADLTESLMTLGPVLTEAGELGAALHDEVQHACSLLEQATTHCPTHGPDLLDLLRELRVVVGRIARVDEPESAAGGAVIDLVEADGEVAPLT